MAGKRTTTVARVEGVPPVMHPGSIFAYEQRQLELSKTGRADGQCPHCKAFRMDGYPPTFHTRECPRRSWNLPNG